MGRLRDTLDITPSLIHQRIEFLEEDGIYIAIDDRSVIAVGRRHLRLVPNAGIVRKEANGAIRCQFHDCRVSILGIMETGSPCINGKEPGIDDHLTVSGRSPHDLRMDTVGVERMVVLRQTVEVWHDLRCQDPVLQTLQNNQYERGLQGSRIRSVVKHFHHLHVTGGQRTVRLDILDHQIVVRADIERRIEHAGVGYRSREIRAIDRFPVLTDERHRIVLDILLLHSAVDIVHINGFARKPQPDGDDGHSQPCPETALAGRCESKNNTE